MTNMLSRSTNQGLRNYRMSEPTVREVATAELVSGWNDLKDSIINFIPSSLVDEKILIVDTHTPMINLIKDMLRRGGASKLYDADNYSQAIRLLKENRFALVICDFELRGAQSNGHSLLVDARRQKLLPYSTSFIVLSSEASERMMFAALEESPDDYIHKPINAKDLIDRIIRIANVRSVFKPAFDDLDNHNERAAVSWLRKKIAQLKTPSLAMTGDRLLGRILIESALYKEADLHYREMEGKDYPVPWATMGKGIANFFLGRLPDAKRCFAELLNQRFLALEAYDWLARIHCLEQDYDLAQYAMELASSLSPLSMHKQSLLGHVAFLNGQYGVAERAFRCILYGHKNIAVVDSDLYRRIVWGHKKNTRSPTEEDVGSLDKMSKTLQVLSDKYPRNADLQIKSSIIEATVAVEQGDEKKAHELTDVLLEYYLKLDVANQFADEALMKAHFRHLGRDFTQELANLIKSRENLSQEALLALSGARKTKLEKRLQSHHEVKGRQEKSRQKLKNARQLKQLHEQQYKDAEQEVKKDLYIEAQRSTPRLKGNQPLTDEEWEQKVSKKYGQLVNEELELRIERKLTKKSQAMAAISNVTMMPIEVSKVDYNQSWHELVEKGMNEYGKEQFEASFFTLLRAVKEGGERLEIKLNMVQAGVSACREGTFKEKQIFNICLFYMRPLVKIVKNMTAHQRERFLTITQALKAIDDKLEVHKV